MTIETISGEGYETQERVGFGKNSWLMIPFYADPELPGYKEAVGRFAGFIEHSKDITGLNLAVIDDGSGLTPDLLNNVPDRLITIPENMGKANAVRVGLNSLLNEPANNLGFLVQYYGDGDQASKDIPRVQKKIVEISRGNPEIPALVIGDRYSEELTVTPNPESVAYRQSLLTFFGSIARTLGHDENVRDWVSGARAYTRRYAKEFLAKSKSGRYGVECEQLVVASLVGAKVATAPLTVSRPRDTSTLTSKWLQNFEVFLGYEDALRERGKGPLVDLVGNLVEMLKQEVDEFDVNLSPLGEETEMHFTRQGDRYTALIPPDYRAKIFDTERNFPFTIRKNI